MHIMVKNGSTTVIKKISFIEKIYNIKILNKIYCFLLIEDDSLI